MASENAYLRPEDKMNAIEKLKMGAVLLYTLPGVPCIYYGDENGAEGHIDPFCRRCFDWENLNEDLIVFFSKLGKIRNDFKEIFADGRFENIYTKNSLIFYKRKSNNKNIYIFANNSSEKYLINLPGKYHELLKDEQFENIMEISENSYGIFYEI